MNNPASPASAAIWVPIENVTPWGQNPRINDAAVEQVAASIKRFGWGSPIIARKADGVIIAGHTRLKAAKQMGMDKVLVRYLDLDPAQAAALALADNKLNEIAEWDDYKLAEVLKDLSEQSFDLNGLGWDSEGIATILESASAFDEAWESALGDLPEGDRAPVQTMSFTLHDEQAELVVEALAAAKKLGKFGETGNTNSNGNALARICGIFLTQNGSI